MKNRETSLPWTTDSSRVDQKVMHPFFPLGFNTENKLQKGRSKVNHFLFFLRQARFCWGLMEVKVEDFWVIELRFCVCKHQRIASFVLHRHQLRPTTSRRKQNRSWCLRYQKKFRMRIIDFLSSSFFKKSSSYYTQEVSIICTSSFFLKNECSTHFVYFAFCQNFFLNTTFCIQYVFNNFWLTRIWILSNFFNIYIYI